MIILGLPIAQKIYTNLRLRSIKLRQRNLIPSLAIIQIGDNALSSIYISQKKKHCESVGIDIIIHKLPQNISFKQLAVEISKFNNDQKISGIIIQLPIPDVFGLDEVLKLVKKEKDVDGFLAHSPYTNPVAKAVVKVLEHIGSSNNLPLFLKDKYIVVIGKGKTGGKPVFLALKKISKNVKLLHSKSIRPDQVIKMADVVISCVGKTNIVNEVNLKKGSILIGVGMHRLNNRLLGDYNERKIKNIAGYYTPNPKGLGPITVACLLENVIQACEK